MGEVCQTVGDLYRGGSRDRGPSGAVGLVEVLEEASALFGDRRGGRVAEVSESDLVLIQSQ